jgi:hypothetical protein
VEEGVIAMWSSSSFARTKAEAVERETRELLVLWEEVGGRGLDTWFELPAWYAMPDCSGGEPGGGYEYLSLVEDYFTTLDAEEKDHHDEYVTWLKRLFKRMRGR